jgi:hypothetical protein
MNDYALAAERFQANHNRSPYLYVSRTGSRKIDSCFFIFFVTLRDYMIAAMNTRTFAGSILLLLLFIVPANSQAIKNAIPDVARPLPLSSVRITGGPLKRAQDLNADYLLKLEPDRMMAYYRKRAGLEPKAQGYPGWDGDGKILRVTEWSLVTLVHVAQDLRGTS